MAKVSIIIPIYNVAPYLRRCLDSVVNQTLQDIEIILASDGPQDCHDICDEYARKDERIKVIKDKGSYGRSANAGLDIASSDYIGIVESDDWCSPDMFEKLYDTAKKHNADVVKSRYKTIYPNRIECSYMPHCATNTNLDIRTCPRLLFTPPSIWAAIYNKKFLTDNNIRFIEDRISYIDTPFFAETLIKAKRFVIIDDCLYNYCSDNPNQSIKSNEKIMDGIIGAKYLYSRVSKDKNFSKFRDYFYRFSIMHLLWQFNRISRPNKQVFFDEVKKYVSTWDRPIKKTSLLKPYEKLFYKALVHNKSCSYFENRIALDIRRIKIFNRITVFRIITYPNRQDYILFKHIKLYTKRKSDEA